jgi:hypothetical protein
MPKGRKTGGRAKGTPNKVTGALREMVLAALEAAGGVEYLARQAEQNPAAFLTLLGKVLPLTVQGPATDGAHRLARVIVQGVAPKAPD